MDDQGAFPAPEQTPGQKESRQAYAQLLERKSKPKWWQDYQELRALGWDWRKAAYIAWESSPVRGRWPKTVEELAVDVLGLRSSRVIRKWKEKDPTIEKTVEVYRVAPMARHIRDVIDALVAVAKRHDPKAHRDRKLFLEITKIYKPRRAMELMGEEGGPIEYTDLDEEYRRDIEELTRRLNDSGASPAGRAPEGEDDDDEDDEG